MTKTTNAPIGLPADVALMGTIAAAPPFTPEIVMHGLRITKDGIMYNGQQIKDAGTVHALLLDVLTGKSQLPAAVPFNATSEASGSDATAEMLNMLGRLHPFAMEANDRAKAYERLERAFVIQQPWPVPDQACIVWRGDLMDMRYDLVHKQAVFESWKRESENQSSAARDILAERRRQVDAEGWTPEHDDGYTDGALARSAAAYTLNTVTEDGPHYWPWPQSWWKPTDARRDLVKAGALILAEIERLDRAAGNGGRHG